MQNISTGVPSKCALIAVLNFYFYFYYLCLLFAFEHSCLVVPSLSLEAPAKLSRPFFPFPQGVPVI